MTQLHPRAPRLVPFTELGSRSCDFGVFVVMWKHGRYKEDELYFIAQSI